uniref:Uncharacterized protein n=1 Tax=Arundo donax TaxID=35708 RepID=A0A0A9GFK2_ARUDO
MKETKIMAAHSLLLILVFLASKPCHLFGIQ